MPPAAAATPLEPLALFALKTKSEAKPGTTPPPTRISKKVPTDSQTFACAEDAKLRLFTGSDQPSLRDVPSTDPNIFETRANSYHRFILAHYAKECPGESIAHHTAFRSTSAVNGRVRRHTKGLFPCLPAGQHSRHDEHGSAAVCSSGSPGDWTGLDWTGQLQQNQKHQHQQPSAQMQPDARNMQNPGRRRRKYLVVYYEVNGPGDVATYLRLEAGCADPFSDSHALHARLCLFCLTEEDSLPGSPYYRVYYDR
ncbi:hypothetical protein Q7P36_004375 [Cladosporium allicinum]